MEAVHQLQLNTQVLLSQVVQHPGRGGIIKWSMDETKDYLRCSLIISAPGIHEALHEGGPVLGQAEAGQPLVPDPLVVHVPVCERGAGGGGGRGRGEADHLLDGEPQLEAVQRVADADLALDLGVGQRGHDGAGLHVGATRGHVPAQGPVNVQTLGFPSEKPATMTFVKRKKDHFSIISK